MDTLVAEGHLLIHGDALAELTAIATETVDMVFLDPGTARDLHYPDRPLDVFVSAKTPFAPPRTLDNISDILAAIDEANPEWLAYIHAVASESYRTLRSTGSIYLEVSPQLSAYLRIVLDSVFGPKNFRNELVRRLGDARRIDRGFPVTTSRLLYYVKSQTEAYFDNVKPEPKQGISRSAIIGSDGLDLVNPPLSVASDVWSFPGPSPVSRERLGRRGQDPVGLAERMIRASVPPGGLVLDPFCGTGTTLAAAHRLRRRWIGVDRDYAAIALVRHRATLIGLRPDDLRVQNDLESRVLSAETEGESVELWALAALGARPVSPGSRKRGFDGQIIRHVQGQQEPVRILVEVKSRRVPPTVQTIRDLRDALRQERATLGLLVTRQQLPRRLREELEREGNVLLGGQSYPKIQAITLDELATAPSRLRIP